MTVRTNIAAGLKKSRKAAGLNVDEVGTVLGKSGKTISAWEVGRGQPDGDELIVLCRLFGVHLRDFYGDEYDDLVTENDSELSPDEQELIKYYRGTANAGKRGIINAARMFYEEMKDGDWLSLIPEDVIEDLKNEPEPILTNDDMIAMYGDSGEVLSDDEIAMHEEYLNSIEIPKKRKTLYDVLVEAAEKGKE